MKIDQKTVVWGLAGAAGAYFLGKFVIKDAAGEAVEAVNKNFNPAEQTNLANRAFSAVYRGGLDGKGTLGTDIYDGVQAIKGWYQGIAEKITIRDQGPAEGSTTPNEWQHNTPGPSAKAPVYKSRLNQIQTR